MLRSDNPILYALSRLHQNKFNTIGCKYGIDLLSNSYVYVKEADVWWVFAGTVTLYYFFISISMHFMYVYCVYFIVCCQWRNQRWFHDFSNNYLRRHNGMLVVNTVYSVLDKLTGKIESDRVYQSLDAATRPKTIDNVVGVVLAPPWTPSLPFSLPPRRTPFWQMMVSWTTQLAISQQSEHRDIRRCLTVRRRFYIILRQTTH